VHFVSISIVRRSACKGRERGKIEAQMKVNGLKKRAKMDSPWCLCSHFGESVNHQTENDVQEQDHEEDVENMIEQETVQPAQSGDKRSMIYPLRIRIG